MFKNKEYLKDFYLPLLVQILLTGILCVLHINIVKLGPMIMPETINGVEETLPTLGRAIYCIVSLILGILISHLTVQAARNENFKLSLYYGFSAGTLLWQSFGEDIWHFGFHEEDKFINFVHIETGESLPVFLIFTITLIFLVLEKNMDWGFQVILLAFLLNWGGHFLLIGTYPLVEGIIERGIWYKSFGTTVSAISAILAIYFGTKEKCNIKNRLLLSMLFYFSVGSLFFSFIDS